MRVGGPYATVSTRSLHRSIRGWGRTWDGWRSASAVPPLFGEPGCFWLRTILEGLAEGLAADCAPGAAHRRAHHGGRGSPGRRSDGARKNLPLSPPLALSLCHSCVCPRILFNQLLKLKSKIWKKVYACNHENKTMKIKLFIFHALCPFFTGFRHCVLQMCFLTLSFVFSFLHPIVFRKIMAPEIKEQALSNSDEVISHLNS